MTDSGPAPGEGGGSSTTIDRPTSEPDRAAAGIRTASDDALHALGAEHFRRVSEVSDAFFEARADDVSRTCRAMARRFHRDGRLLVFSPPGPSESDAYHVSVEFVHPVLVGKKALPATVLAGDPVLRVESLGREEDIALGLTTDGEDEGVVSGLRAARRLGLLTVGLAGGDGGRMAEEPLDHLFVVPAGSPAVVQEVQETLYHVLWELVHVFFDHEGQL